MRVYHNSCNRLLTHIAHTHSNWPSTNRFTSYFCETVHQWISLHRVGFIVSHSFVSNYTSYKEYLWSAAGSSATEYLVYTRLRAIHNCFHSGLTLHQQQHFIYTFIISGERQMHRYVHLIGWKYWNTPMAMHYGPTQSHIHPHIHTSPGDTMLRNASHTKIQHKISQTHNPFLCPFPKAQRQLLNGIHKSLGQSVTTSWKTIIPTFKPSTLHGSMRSILHGH